MDKCSQNQGPRLLAGFSLRVWYGRNRMLVFPRFVMLGVHLHVARKCLSLDALTWLQCEYIVNTIYSPWPFLRLLRFSVHVFGEQTLYLTSCPTEPYDQLYRTSPSESMQTTSASISYLKKKTHFPYCAHSSSEFFAQSVCVCMYVYALSSLNFSLLWNMRIWQCCTVELQRW